MSDVEKGETPVATAAVPVAAAATGIPMRDQEKIGAKCCGCLCDYRRAVVAGSIVCIVWYIIAIILAATGVGAIAVVNDNSDTLDLTDEDQQDLTYGGADMAVLIVIYALLMCFAIFALVAALRFSVCMLGTVVFLILVQFGWSLYLAIANVTFTTATTTVSIIISIIAYGLWLYPVIGLITEIKSGVMSCKTYPREAYSCCCSPKV